jgi:hypothetical protein
MQNRVLDLTVVQFPITINQFMPMIPAKVEWRNIAAPADLHTNRKDSTMLLGGMKAAMRQHQETCFLPPI